MGVDAVYNHADYRLISSRVLQEFAKFHEVNLFLRGMIPLVGFPSTSVYYERNERMAGESHYPLSKMFTLAFDGITSLSIKPIRMLRYNSQYFRNPLGYHRFHTRIHSFRMGEPDMYCVFLRRSKFDGTWSHWRVCGEDLY